MKKKIKVLKDPLSEELKKLNYSYNQCRSRIQYRKDARTYGLMAEAFGIKVLDGELANRAIWIKDVEIFKQQVEQLIKERYARQRYIPLVSVEKDSSLGESKNEEKGESEIVSEDILHKQIEQPTTFCPKYESQKAILMVKYCNQEKAARELWQGFEKGKRAQLLLATTGAGKTYIGASFLKNFIEQGFIKKLGSYAPWPTIVITKASVVAQTATVLKDEFGIDLIKHARVINIEFLRSQLGKNFVAEVVKVAKGEDYIDYTWNPIMHPIFVLIDECQMLTREVSIQSQIIQALTRVEDEYGIPVFFLFMSATPFARVCEMKIFACATRREFDFGLQRIRITEDSWPTFATQIAYPSDPTIYCEAAIKRAIDFFEDDIVRIKGIRPKFRALNRVQRIFFRTNEEREEYSQAWETYQEKKRKIEGDDSLSASQSRFALLAQFTIFRKAAEKIRRYHLAKFAVDAWNNGKAPAIACSFKGTMTAVYRILVENYNWQREDVSFIWGGSTETLNDKSKIAQRFKNDAEFAQAMKSFNISLEDLGIDSKSIVTKTEEQYEFEKAHVLLTQSPEMRERERLNFQRQDSRLLLFSYKAGGVGLSAHHEAKYPNARQREGIFTPVYSEKELIQAFGRLPRITSISDTSQTMCYYGGTIEDAVAARVVMKLKCMKEVVKIRESWEDIITGQPVEETEDEKEIMDAVDDLEQTALLGEFVEEEK